MKILLLNAQYGLGMNGSWREYFRYFNRFFYCPKKVHHENSRKVRNLILREKPDLVMLMEVNDGMVSRLMTANQAFVSVDNKYALNGMWSKMPMFRKNSNAFIALKQTDFKKHYFKKGMKRLVYELSCEQELSLFSAHFSIFKKTRAKQLVELQVLIKEKKNVILCGDFNIFKGYDELKLLLADSKLQLLNKEEHKTFPTFKPKKALDLFMCSTDMKVKSFRVLKDRVSDHLPVMLEI
ncbi:MAG: endonuclease/exonuclease/phosphatase family protein [Patescibacteria group bacterium]